MTDIKENIEQIRGVSDTDKVWNKLWEFACNQIIWGEGTIDYDSFVEVGKEIFNVELKQ